MRALCLAVVLALAGCATERVVEKAPPPDRREEPRPKPAAAYFWVPGHWVWSGETKDHYWSGGRWEADRPGFMFVPGVWTKSEAGWRWNEERWEKRR